MSVNQKYSFSNNEVSIGNKRASERKIFLGKGYDVRQPLPILNNTVRERFLKSRSNYWTPNELPIAEDKIQIESGLLNEDEFWMFKTNISYLTASDNLVPDNIVNVLLKYCTSNEVRQYLRWQIAEEANHIESYLFILESIGLDTENQGKIFNLYQEIPELSEKLNWNIYFTNLVLSNDGNDLESSEFLNSLVSNLVSYYIFEFLYFPLGFSQIFALARLGKLRNIAQQYQYIWRDENNHSENNLWLIKSILAENKHLLTSKLTEQMRFIICDSVDIEVKYAQKTMPNKGINGYSTDDYVLYAKFLADLACYNLGLKKIFNVNSHPIPWMSEFEMNHEVNFFEGQVTEYQKTPNLEW